MLLPTHNDFVRALERMGVRPPAAGQEESWREDVLKPMWRDRVKATHPDLAHGDPVEVARRTLAMQQTNADYALLQTLKVVPSPRARVWTVTATAGSVATVTISAGTPMWGGGPTWGRGGPINGMR